MWHTIGFIFGAFMGMVLIGGLFGWAAKRLFKKSTWAQADGGALVAVALLGGLTASNGTLESYVYYATIYLIAAFPAFFVLQRLRKTEPSGQ